MNSIEVLVPRNVIKVYPHPEPYGDGVCCDLINGMFTDVFYREEGHFTITNDDALIAYLNTIKPQPREYFYRNEYLRLEILKTMI